MSESLSFGSCPISISLFLISSSSSLMRPLLFSKNTSYPTHCKENFRLKTKELETKDKEQQQEKQEWIEQSVFFFKAYYIWGCSAILPLSCFILEPGVPCWLLAFNLASLWSSAAPVTPQLKSSPAMCVCYISVFIYMHLALPVYQAEVDFQEHSRQHEGRVSRRSTSIREIL